MNRKLAVLLAAALIALMLPTAFAADARIESAEYKGYNILKLDFSRSCDWFASASIVLNDTTGAEIPYTFIGGEDEEAYLRTETSIDGLDLNLHFTLGETSQSLSFAAKTGVEYKFKGDQVYADVEKEKCDFCKDRGHDEDYCPERIDPAALPDDADGLARIFDIDRCDRCGGMGHDDDRCPNK